MHRAALLRSSKACLRPTLTQTRTLSGSANKVYESAAAAVADIPDGAKLCVL